MWYLAKRKTEDRWRAYKLEQEPELKRGYEMKGPFKSLFKAIVVANETDKERTMKSRNEAGFSTIESAIVMAFLLALVAVFAVLILGAGAPTNKVTEAVIETIENLPEAAQDLSDDTDGWELVGDNAIRQTVKNAFDNGDAEVDIDLPVTPDVPVELLELARSIENDGGSIEDVIEALSEKDVNVVLMQAILAELGFNTPSQ